MAKLTERQQQVYNYIRETVNARGYPPSVREICDAVGLSSPSTVHSHIASLVKAGLLRKDASKPRAIEILDPVASRPVSEDRIRQVPLLGRIAAGSPILAAEDVEDVFPLPTDIVGTGPIFMLRIKGDSMIEAGILEGDYVVIRRQPDANDGDIIVALVEGEEATVKRLRRENGKVILVPENQAYSPTEYTDGVQVLGRVVSVLRRVR